jgi:hypothetical protein
MNEFQINQLLVKKGIKKSDVARRLNEDFPNLSLNYAKKIIYNLISGREWSPTYAEWLNKNYGIEVQKPNSAIPVRQRLQRQAA